MLTAHIAIVVPFIMAIFIPFIAKRFSQFHIGWFVLLIPATLFVALARYIPAIANGKTYVHTVQWIPTFNIHFPIYLDGLSMVFSLLITGIGALVVLYSIYYLSREESLTHFYIYLLIFMGSMLGVVFSDHLLVFYLFWELTSISSFLLIAFWYHRKQSRYGAQKSLLITVSGGVAMLIGFLMLYQMTDTFSIREIVLFVSENVQHEFFLPAMLLILLGAFTKSTQFPFHIWLPDAMEAPTPVSAYLHSATMVKAGIYLIARFTPVFGGNEVWFWVISSIGLLTLLWGAFTAVRQTDLKALLAYSTISQLGLITCLFGIGSVAFALDYRVEALLFTQAIFAALFHLVNHSTFKGALFMVVGIVDLEGGTRDIRRLGGLIALMPISFTIALIGSFSMAGLPPFNGFLSKEMFFVALLHVAELQIFSLDSWGILFPVIAWSASVLTFIYSLMIVFKTFFGTFQGEKLDPKIREAPPGMLIAPSILASLVIGIFFFPNVLAKYLLHPAMDSIFPFEAFHANVYHEIAIWSGFTSELFMTLGVIVAGTILYMLLKYWMKVYTLFPETWSLDRLYNLLLDGMEGLSRSITSVYMTGHLRDYLRYIFVFFIVLVGGLLIWNGPFTFHHQSSTSVHTYEWLLVFIMFTASITLVFVRSRLAAILLNGVLGFSIAFFFVLFRAPDLALTQLVVETVTTALFLLCFYFLPEWKSNEFTLRTKRFNALLSIFVGLIFIVVAFAVQGDARFDSISDYFENAYELTGGKNIVNSILADFRAFDTMLEVVVIFIAGMGVYTLTKHKIRKEDQKFEDQ